MKKEEKNQKKKNWRHGLAPMNLFRLGFLRHKYPSIIQPKDDYIC
jgi:hypothetical protein